MEFPEFIRSAEDSRRVGAVVETHAETSRFRVEWDDGRDSMEHLDGAGERWTACLPRATAEKCLEIVREHTEKTAGPGWDPALYAPGHEGPYWNVSLEGAEEWTYGISDHVTWPDGVFAQPVYSWCLALYPA